MQPCCEVATWQASEDLNTSLNQNCMPLSDEHVFDLLFSC